MFGFKKSRKEKLSQAYEKKLKEAMAAQRSGDIERYAELTAESQRLLDEIDSLEKAG